MAVSYNYPRSRSGQPQVQFLTPAIILMGLAAMAVLFLFVYEGNFGSEYPYIFLLPWILGLLIVFAIPPAILYRRGELKLHDPLVYATWSYFLPAFGIGGIILAFGWSEPYYLNFVDAPAYNLPL